MVEMKGGNKNTFAKIPILVKGLVLVDIMLNEGSRPYCTACNRDLLQGCLWKWHRNEKGRALSDYETGLVVELVMGWIGK